MQTCIWKEYAGLCPAMSQTYQHVNRRQLLPYQGFFGRKKHINKTLHLKEPHADGNERRLVWFQWSRDTKASGSKTGITAYQYLNFLP